MSRTVAIVQARMGSTRLPGKVLMDLSGKPMLRHVVERLQRANRIDEVIVATSDAPEDRAILQLAESVGCRAIAGSQNDVLDRYAKAATAAEATTVVRVTSDCPLIDPEVVDRTLQMYFEQGVDYAANCIQQTFPRGVENEVFSAERLLQIAQEADLPLEREHVTPHFYLHPDKYQLRFLAAEGELCRPDLRLCVDTPEDYALLSRIFEQLGPDNRFSIRDVVRLLDQHKELLRLNEEIRQKKLGQ